MLVHTSAGMPLPLPKAQRHSKIESKSEFKRRVWPGFSSPRIFGCRRPYRLSRKFYGSVLSLQVLELRSELAAASLNPFPFPSRPLEHGRVGKIVPGLGEVVGFGDDGAAQGGPIPFLQQRKPRFNSRSRGPPRIGLAYFCGIHSDGIHSDGIHRESRS